MKWIVWKKMNDTAMFFVAAALFGSGLGMVFETNEGIGDVHKIVGLVFIGLTIMHVLLSREWIFKSLAKGRRSTVVAGVVCAVLVLLTGMLVPLGGDDDDDDESERPQQHSEER